MTPALRTLLALSLCENYNKWLVSLCLPHLGNHNIEVGCGVGNILRHLPNTIGIDSDEQSCRVARALTGASVFDQSLATVHEHARNHSYADCIVCANVLEHIFLDTEALCQMRSLLVPGGRLCLFVPAGKRLYGSLDRALGHHRRYSKTELLRKMTDAGFRVIDCHHFNPVGIVGWAVNNLFRMKHTSLWSVMAFDQLVPILKRLPDLRFGLSIFAVGVK